MAEAYPSDNELLNLIVDADTGVEYIPTGTAPYYLHFRKLLYRLLLATKRANDLRVFEEDGLDIGVRSGKYWIGTSLVSYAGSSGNTLADNKANIFIYLDADGNLVTDEYTAFPDMSVVSHVRLAVATTSAGSVTSITDGRDHHSIAMPQAGGTVRIEAHTANDQLTENETGSVHTNLGATGVVILTLPAGASAGTKFTFAVQAVQEFRIDPGSAAIRDDSGATADKYKWANAVGESIVVVADNNGDWVTVSKRGIWVEEA
ncbi:MAG: hypothetical protein KAS23_05825 [Anaerohalosphaera sp.]|nr:hypothetical protein [Anaerohalosphaera sp.]